jgi:hypothetical protein
VFNSTRVVRAVSHVLYSLDATARIITLRVLGELAPVVHTDDVDQFDARGSQSDAQQLVYHQYALRLFRHLLSLKIT